MRKAASALAALLLLPAQAMAFQTAPAEIAPTMRQVGQADFNYLFWDIFKARLFAAGQAFSWQAPFALSLEYEREFTAEELTEKTIESMDRLTAWPKADLASFRKTLAPCMADVREGDRFTAASPNPDIAVLYLNGVERCRLEKPGIRRDYFSIWLSPDSDFPAESKQLLGEASP